MNINATYTGFLRGSCRLLLLLMIGLGIVVSAQAQQRDTTGVSQDSTQIQPNDSTATSSRDSVSTSPADSLRPTRNDSIPGRPGEGRLQGSGPGQGQEGESGVGKPKKEGQVNFQAQDSLIFTFKKDRVATLYGDASAAHKSGTLKSPHISLNLDRHTVSAVKLDSASNDTLTQPILIREDNRVRSDKIVYNYKTQKGVFDVARFKAQQGRIIGTKGKKTAPNVVFLKDAKYTTSKLKHPTYYIKAKKMKIVDQDKIFFQNAQLYILDIPYPLIFPFGYIPPNNIKKKQSGLLKPRYSFENKQKRGIGLQNLGWFQYFSNYFTGQASFNIFTSGSYSVDAQANYRNRNKLNGNIQLGYSRDNSGLESTDPDFTTTVQKRLRITHSQDLSPYASFNANVNLRTSDYFKKNSYNPTDRAETSTSSSLRYQYRQPENNYNFSVSLRQNQNFKTHVTSLSGPDMNFSLRRLTPFANDQTRGDETKWYEKISMQYSNSFNGKYRFDPVRKDSARVNWFEALLDPSKYRQATDDNDHYQYGFRQQGSVSMGQIIPSQFLNVSANINYNEYWFPATTRKSFNADSNEVIDRKIRGFTTARDFSTSLNFSTTFYGLANVNFGKFKSIRHTLRPSISFSYRPDFSDSFWGYYRKVRTDTASNRIRKYSIFENQIFSGPGQGEQQSLSFSLSNVLEGKKVYRDSTGEKKEDVVRLINSFNLSTSYNFAADSLKLSNLNTSLNADVIDGMSIRANADFNFYERDNDGRKIDKFLITNSGKPFEMVSFSASTSYNFKFGDQSSFQSRRGGGRYGGGSIAGRSSGRYGNSNRYGSNSRYGNNSQYGNTHNQNTSTGISRKGNFPAHYDPFNQQEFHPVDPHFNDRHVNGFRSPFSFSVNFSYRWSKGFNGNDRYSATLNASNINFKLTPKWSFSTQIGYDFIRHELTPSQFSLNRDLIDWNMSFTMNPFGENPYYFFSLNVNAGQLQTIFQKLPLLKNLQRSSGSTGRRPNGFY